MTDSPETPDRPASAGRSARDAQRAARNNDRLDRPATDRPARSDSDRPARDSNDRPARNTDRSDRPARSGDRPDRGERGERSSYTPRPDRSDRPARSTDRPERPARSGDRPDRGERGSYTPRPDRSTDRPARTGDRPAYPPRSSGGDRPDRPARSSDRRPGTGQKLWTDNERPARNDRGAGDRNAAANAQAAADWEDRDPFNTRAVRSRHDDPIIPEDVDGSELDRVARNELKTLSKDNAEGVAQHLVMAARLIESDPEEAHRHAISAARRAGRIGMVRETLAITAYTTGDYALALRELRTHRRITGTDTQLPLMVDTERALGRPAKALELARSVPKASLPVAVQVDLSIAASGARLDLGQAEAALQELTIPQLDRTRIHDFSPALFAAYATCLEELGRQDEADLWWGYADTAAEVLEEHEAGQDGETITIIEDELDVDADEVDSDDDADSNEDVETDADEITTDDDTVSTLDDTEPMETVAIENEESTTNER